MKQSNSIIPYVMWSCIATVILSLLCVATAYAAPDHHVVLSGVEPGHATVTYLGSEVATDGNPVSTWYVSCDGDYWVTLKVSYTDGSEMVATGDYCGVKLYTFGSVETVTVEGVIDAPETKWQVWLPVVSK